jgi:hypothetical protein
VSIITPSEALKEKEIMNIEVLPETEARIELAKYLLLNANYTPEDIRIELGYETLAEFDRDFVESAGRSIDAYRRDSLPVVDQIEWLPNFEFESFEVPVHTEELELLAA